MELFSNTHTRLLLDKDKQHHEIVGWLILNSQSLKELLLSGESETVEFKTSFGKEAIETLVAFANTKGGTILIGVNDKGEVAGVKIGQVTIQNWVNQIKQTRPPLL